MRRSPDGQCSGMGRCRTCEWFKMQAGKFEAPGAPLALTLPTFRKRTGNLRRRSSAEMERMMKVQEVILKAMAGSLKWWEAAEIIGVTDRTMRRWRERYEKDGYDGLYDYRKQQPSPKRIAVKTLEEVLQLYREKHFDFKLRHL